MMHIAITAGGTEEPIDGVRKITNMSSGSLGWHCLEAVLAFMRKQAKTDFVIHYIKAPQAVTRKLGEEDASHVDFINVSNTQSVYDSIDALMDKVNVDFFIHAMAISDFSYAYSASISSLAKELHQHITANKAISKEEIESVLSNPKTKHDADEKIASTEKIIMGFETTPKVISLIKQKNRETFLVGFKLVKHNNDNNLMKEAEKLRLKNNCDAVFANEASQLSEKGHTGLLLHKGEIVARPVSKREIAESIVKLGMQQTALKH